MDNVGLSTPRGSGTSGYVQRNLAHIKPRNQPIYNDEIKEHRPREPNQEILDHERKREVESKVFDLRDKLEDEDVDEDEIDRRCDVLRTQLLAKLNRPAPRNARREFKSHEVHEMASAKQRESDRMRRALRLGRGGPLTGSSTNPANRRDPGGPSENAPRDDFRRRDDRKDGGDRRYRDRDAPRERRSWSPRGREGRYEKERIRERSLRRDERNVSRGQSVSSDRSFSRSPKRESKWERRISRGRSVSRSPSGSESRSPVRRRGSRSLSRTPSPSRSPSRFRSLSRSRSP